MGKLTRTKIDRATEAFLKKGGQVTRFPAGASVYDPLSLPEGEIRDRAVKRSLAARRNAPRGHAFRNEAARTRLIGMLEKRAPLMDILRHFYPGYIKNGAWVSTPVKNLFANMRDLGVECPGYLIEERDALLNGPDAIETTAPAACDMLGVEDMPSEEAIDAMELVRDGAPPSAVARLTDLDRMAVVRHVEKFFGEIDDLRRFRSRSEMVEEIRAVCGLPPERVERLCLVCHGDRGSMEGRKGSRCAVCAGEIMIRRDCA